MKGLLTLNQLGFCKLHYWGVISVLFYRRFITRT
jgi:hypothetical protein